MTGRTVQGGKTMKRPRTRDPWEALQRVTEAAERFVNRSPRSKRLETERQALLDAIIQAQLALSVQRLATLSNDEALEANLVEHQKPQRTPRKRATVSR